MKIEVGGRSFEFKVDGKDLEDSEVLSAFIALGSVSFPFVVVARGSVEDAPVRAVTFAVDEKYVNTLIDAMEPVLEPDEEIGLLVEDDAEG